MKVYHCTYFCPTNTSKHIKNVSLVTMFEYSNIGKVIDMYGMYGCSLEIVTE